jgi:hypothetical protein
VSEKPGIAPDGSPVALYSRLPALGEPELIHDSVPARSEILELGPERDESLTGSSRSATPSSRWTSRRRCSR